MIYVLGILLAFGSAFAGFIIITKTITKFTLSEGKSEKKILEKYTKLKNKPSRFLLKYPEADIRAIRSTSLAFGFIFAFASGLFAFSVLGKQTVFSIESVESPPVISINPPITFRKKTKEVPKLQTKKINNPIIKTKPEIFPEIFDSSEIKLPYDSSDLIGDPNPIIYKPEVLKKEPEFLFESQEMPRYIGCKGIKEDKARICTNDKILKYVSKLEIPKEAESDKLFIEFMVGKNGKIQDVNLLKGNDKNLIQAAIKHIKKMPKFAQAGMQNGKPVRIKYVVPINIKLD